MSRKSLPSGLGFSVIALLLFLLAMVVVIRCHRIRYCQCLDGPEVIDIGKKFAIK